MLYAPWNTLAGGMKRRLHRRPPPGGVLEHPPPQHCMRDRPECSDPGPHRFWGRVRGGCWSIEEAIAAPDSCGATDPGKPRWNLGKQPASTDTAEDKRISKKKPRKKTQKRNRKGRVRETAAVSLVCKKGATYQDALVKARESINLKELGFETMTVRRELTGAFIWSIKGKEAAAKADRVAEALKKTVPEAKVSRLQRMGTVGLVGMDPGLNATIVRNAQLELKEGVNSNYIGVEEIRARRGQLGETVVTAPLATIQAPLNKSRISFGWFTARVVSLRQRPLQCLVACLGAMSQQDARVRLTGQACGIGVGDQTVLP
ncbi:hypothetical protein M0804_014083 [Polistes exclamans]|nr:hypothetical protein M0804_014083 [Polistes exclamans]